MASRRDFMQSLSLALGGMPAATRIDRAELSHAEEPPVAGPGRAPASHGDRARGADGDVSRDSRLVSVRT